MKRISAIALFVLLTSATTAQAVITKLTPLAEVLESDQYIFVAKVDNLDPDNKERPSAVFKLDKKLKGEPPFERIPVNMTGDDEGKKAGATKTIFDRLDATRQIVFFVRKQGKIYNAKVFVEGSWFSVYGTLDGDTVRWAFLHGEPFLRRTFKGTSAEMIKTVEDSIAKKAKPPEPDEKAKEGYGPPVEKPKKCDEPTSTSLALFGVIPSFVLIGPLAIIAALFPGVFARMAVGMKRWRAFLTIASINSTLALIYWVVLTYRPNWLPSGWWLAPRTVTIYLMLIAAVGMMWAGRRYRRLATTEPTVTGTPAKTELYALLGLTAFAAISTVLTAIFADWNSTLEIPMREFTFIGIALSVATVYAAYRAATKTADVAQPGTEPTLRLSLSGESVALGVLVLCGLVTVLGGARSGAGVGDAQAGDADTVIGPRLTGEPVALEAHEIEGGKKEAEFGRVWSGIAVDGDRIYFGTDTGRGDGRILGINRTTGKIDWSFDAPGMKKVFCTPTIANGKVYCGEGEHEDKGCRLFCVNVSDQNHAWKEPLKTASHTEGAPAVAGGKVYFPAGDDGLFCCDANTGEKKWQFPGGKEKGIHIDAAPVVANGTVFVGSGLYTYVAVAIDANSGTEKWRTDLKLRAFGAPNAVGGKVFYAVGTGNMGADVYKYDEEGEMRDKEPAGAVVCLDAAGGKEEWRYELPRSVHTGVAVDGFTAYVGCRDGFVYALDRKSGKLRWKTGIGGAVLSCPAVAANGGSPVAVYAVSQEGLMVCLNPHTGAVCWQKQLPGYRWDGTAVGGVMCTPVVVSTATATSSKRTIYVGGMTVDPQNLARKTVAVFKFEDTIGE